MNIRHLAALCAILALSASACGSGHATPTPTPSPTATPIIPDSVATTRIAVPKTVSIPPPAVFGNTVVWASSPNRKSTVFYSATITPWHVHRLAASIPGPFAFDTGPRLSASWMVWVNYSHRDWTLFALNRRTSRRYTLDSSKTEGPLTQLNLGVPIPWATVYKNTAAWSFTACQAHCGAKHPKTISEIVTEALPTGKSITRYTTHGLCYSLWPSLWARTLVWHQEGNCGTATGSDILLENLKTHSAPRFLTYNHGSTEAVTNGRIVAWVEGSAGATRFDEGKVLMIDDLASGLIHGINTTGAQLSGDEYPTIDGNYLVWLTNNGTDMVGLDLTKNEPLVIRDEENKHARDALGTPGQISDGHVVYADCREAKPGHYAGCKLKLALSQITPGK